MKSEWLLQQHHDCAISSLGSVPILFKIVSQQQLVCHLRISPAWSMCGIPKRRIAMKTSSNRTKQVYKQLLLRLVLKQLVAGYKMSSRTAEATPTGQSGRRIPAKDLDVNSDLSLDIRQLIEQSLQGTGSSPSQLFPELLSQDTSLNTSQVVNVNNTVAGDLGASNLQNCSVNSITDLGSMPHIVLETDQSGQTILIVKNEPDANTVEDEFEEQSFDDLSVPPSPAPSSVSSGRNTYKAKAPSKRRQLEKGSNEYTQKRERNNIAVRKSRDKAKVRQKETEEKVNTLTRQNDNLQKKVDLLTKELNVLKGLFANVGAALPKEYKQFIAKTVNRT